MKEIVIKSLMCAVYGIESRKNSHEMFGYDFMVDTNYKVWLLEINSSPSMDYSTVTFCFIYSACYNKTGQIGLIRYCKIDNRLC